jgi:hypothetical protein
MSCRTQFRCTFHADAFRLEGAALNTFIARQLDSEEAAELYVADRDEESVSIATAYDDSGCLVRTWAARPVHTRVPPRLLR